MKKSLTILILILLAIPVVYAAPPVGPTFDIQLIQDGNDGSTLSIAVQVKGSSLPAENTLKAATIDVTYDNTKLAFYNDASAHPPVWNANIVYLNGYSETSANDNTTFVRLLILGGGVGSSGGGNPPGYGVSTSYDTWVQLKFNILNSSAAASFDVISNSVAISLFSLLHNSDKSGNGTSYTSSSIALHGLSDEPLPVELNSFNAKVKQGDVELAWQTKTEVNNYGFEVERKSAAKSWEKISFIKGNGNSNSEKEYSFVDKNLTDGSQYTYRLKQLDNDGKFSYSDEVEVEVVPSNYELFQNYPNPFNPTTNIKFSLPEDSKVIINIYNMLGQKVMELINSDYQAGFHQVQLNASRLASGVYVYSISAKNFSAVKKMVLMK